MSALSAPAAIDGFAGVTAMLVSVRPPWEMAMCAVARRIVAFVAAPSVSANVREPRWHVAVQHLHAHDLRRLARGELERAGGADVVEVAAAAGHGGHVLRGVRHRHRRSDRARRAARRGRCSRRPSRPPCPGARRCPATAPAGASLGADHHGACAAGDRRVERGHSG